PHCHTSVLPSSPTRRSSDLLKWGLALTVLLGVVFTIVQGIEYSEAGFSFSGNMYGATFFMATGLHGFHVLIGTIFLAVCLLRAIDRKSTRLNSSHVKISYAV